MTTEREARDYSCDIRRWTAVCEGDRSADDHFVYAVMTTGIYCRPSCPSRRPRRDNVRFFEDAEAAASAGFRQCKRCGPAGMSLRQRHASIIGSICRKIDESLEAPSLEELSAEADISPFYLHRLFKRFTGLTPRSYAAARRADRVKRELAGGGEITDAIYAAGYGSSSRFYESAKSRLGMTPTSYRSGGQSERIRFATGQCSLGHLLVAATDAGICDIRIGDDPRVLVEQLRQRFSRAELMGEDRSFESLVQEVISRIEQPHSLAPELPLDIRGTAFQQRVWEALRRVPVGATATYAQVAEEIGKPTATRAVAQACGANRIAVLIPCHRVIRTDGQDGGYRWGVERKRALLAREASNDS